jgi:hypothetical protein
LRVLSEDAETTWQPIRHHYHIIDFISVTFERLEYPSVCQVPYLESLV